MKFAFNNEEMNGLILSLISRRNAILDLVKIPTLADVYTRELEVVESLIERFQPGAVQIIRNMQPSA